MLFALRCELLCEVTSYHYLIIISYVALPARLDVLHSRTRCQWEAFVLPRQTLRRCQLHTFALDISESAPEGARRDFTLIEPLT